MLRRVSGRASGWILGGVLAGLMACERGGAPAGTSDAPDASAPAAIALSRPSPVPLPPPSSATDPNPLRLPSRSLRLDPGRRVFTFSDRMLAGAKLGSTLLLYAATVTGIDGDDLIIEGRDGPSYKVHSAYVIVVPDEPRLRPDDVVLTEWNQVAKHAVIKKIVKDKVVVRYTDMDPKSPEAQLPYQERALPGAKNARFVKQVEGLAPGNYAALQTGEQWAQVLLVSPAQVGDAKRWFALGYGGAAMIVDEADLRPIPIRFKAAVGADVLAEWVGTLRKGTVAALDEPGFFSVRFERAGRPRLVGWGAIMKPL